MTINQGRRLNSLEQSVADRSLSPPSGNAMARYDAKASARLRDIFAAVVVGRTPPPPEVTDEDRAVIAYRRQFRSEGEAAHDAARGRQMIATTSANIRRARDAGNIPGSADQNSPVIIPQLVSDDVGVIRGVPPLPPRTRLAGRVAVIRAETSAGLPVDSFGYVSGCPDELRAQMRERRPADNTRVWNGPPMPRRGRGPHWVEATEPDLPRRQRLR